MTITIYTVLHLKYFNYLPQILFHITQNCLLQMQHCNFDGFGMSFLKNLLEAFKDILRILVIYIPLR